MVSVLIVGSNHELVVLLSSHQALDQRNEHLTGIDASIKYHPQKWHTGLQHLNVSDQLMGLRCLNMLKVGKRTVGHDNTTAGFRSLDLLFDPKARHENCYPREINQIQSPVRKNSACKSALQPSQV